MKLPEIIKQDVHSLKDFATRLTYPQFEDEFSNLGDQLCKERSMEFGEWMWRHVLEFIRNGPDGLYVCMNDEGAATTYTIDELYQRFLNDPLK